MTISRQGWLFGLCMLSVLISIAALYCFSVHTLEFGLQQQMRGHLAVSIDESLFGNEHGRVSDSVSIAYIGRQINKVSNTWVERKWYAAIEPTMIAIDAIDGVAVTGVTQAGTKLASTSFELLRNGRARLVSLRYDYLVRWPAFVMLTAMVIFIFTVTQRIIPEPLTLSQVRWRNTLVGLSYPSDVALGHVASLRDLQLELTPRQREIFDLVHNPGIQNFTAALNAARDARAASLTDLDVEWFGAVLAVDKSIDAAWRAAKHENTVSIDLPNTKLYIRGRDIRVTKTPLFYYAWYALQRLRGDEGWMLNPPSNKPDRRQGEELAKLMWRHKGHAKAISEIEEHGLRAKTLDQNRSKIKEELSAALGQKLAEHYLFDTEKDAHGRLRYRLRLQPLQIKLIESNLSNTELKRPA